MTGGYMKGSKMMNLCTIMIVVAITVPFSCQSSSFLQTENEVRQTVFDDDYVVQCRPEILVGVETSLHLLTINHLDIKNQELSIAGYFHFAWSDTRLSWTGNATLSSIKFIFSNEKEIWTPPVIVENAVDGLDVISTPNIPIRILRHGMVAWLPAGIFTTSCESSVTYWPLDIQTCDVILSSWGYTSGEVMLKFKNTQDALVTTFYQVHGEWELLEKSVSSSIVQRSQESFSRLIFTLKLRRRPLFHMLNTLFPVVLMGFLTVVIFKLSPDSGECVGLALTILLAYAVYLGLITEYIPQTSLSASILSSYLACVLLLQTVAVFLTVIYLDIYLTPEDKPVPRWLHSLTQSCLTKLACVDCSRKTRKVEPIRKRTTSNQNIDKALPTTLPMKTNWDIQVTDEEIGTQESEAENEGLGLDTPEQETYSWKEIALLLDKITMYIYLFVVTGVTATLITIFACHYTSLY